MSQLSLSNYLQFRARSLVGSVKFHRVARSTQPLGPFLQPPFSSAFYSRLLEDWRESGVLLLPLPARIYGVRTLSLRHDIDSVPQQSWTFLNAERKLRVCAAYYFIVDQIVEGFPYAYALEDCRELARAVAEAGGLIGIHSIAWSQTHGLETFKRERERFNDVFGCEASAWTHHGFLPKNQTRNWRLKFELRYWRETGQLFTQPRAVVLSDSQGGMMPERFPADYLYFDFPNEFMSHSDYWHFN